MGKSSSESVDLESFPLLGFTGGFNRPRVMRRSHQHQEFELNYSQQSSLTYLIHGKVKSIPSDRFGFFWAAAPHQLIRVAPDAHFYWFTIPFSWLAQSGLPARFMHRLVAGDLVIDTAPSPRDSFACREWTEDIRASSNERRELAFREITARLHRMALHYRPEKMRRNLHLKEALPVAEGAARHVETMSRFIALHYAEKLRIEDIAAEVRVNPHYAMTIFKELCGMTLLDYIVQHRIFHAQRLLLSSDATVLDIALASGFGSLSRFYQAFEKICGQSPGNYRRRPRPLRL